jgi:hypothetical protein
LFRAGAHQTSTRHVVNEGIATIALTHIAFLLVHTRLPDGQVDRHALFSRTFTVQQRVLRSTGLNLLVQPAHGIGGYDRSITRRGP